MQNIKEFYEKHRKWAIAAISIEATLALILMVLSGSLIFTTLLIVFLAIAFATIIFISQFNVGYGGNQIETLNSALKDAQDTLDEVIAFAQEHASEEEWGVLVKSHDERIKKVQEEKAQAQQTEEESAQKELEEAMKKVEEAKKNKKRLRKLVGKR